MLLGLGIGIAIAIGFEAARLQMPIAISMPTAADRSSMEFSCLAGCGPGAYEGFPIIGAQTMNLFGGINVYEGDLLFTGRWIWAILE